MENGLLEALPLKGECALNLAWPAVCLLVVALFQVSSFVLDMPSPSPAICLI